jgi:SAM-dependent methyltransferase
VGVERLSWGKVTKNLDLRCPCEAKAKLRGVDNGLVCDRPDCPHSNERNCFKIVAGVPVLISELKCDTVCNANSIESYIRRPPRRLSLVKKVIAGESSTTKKNCDRFLEEIKAFATSPKVLVIGSGERGSGTEHLWSDRSIEIHGVDIYASETVEVVCDAHYLPLENESYDGVWIQAVLEHVVDPNTVVAEIFRVLKEGGIVYAETPFMQQVHEGRYDFTRFTVLGHRYLFRRFEALDFGGNKGPEVVLAWAFRYFLWSITRNKTLARVLGLSTGLLLRPFAFLVSEKSMHDASSGVFFMGRKRSNFNLSHKELIALYRGQFS